MLGRRKFMSGSLAGFVASPLMLSADEPASAFGKGSRDLGLWLCGDAHLEQSVNAAGYNCLQQASSRHGRCRIQLRPRHQRR